MLSKKVALITGGYRGIGLETARQLARQKIMVLIGARDDDKAAGAADLLQSEGLDAHPVRLDVTDAADVAALPGFLEDNFERLDILVNNAGVILDRGISVAATQHEIWQQTFDVNVFGLVAVTQALLPLLKRSPAGRIVNLSTNLASLTALSDPKYGVQSVVAPAYIASKAAVNAFTASLANELRRTPIKVNAAHPGWVKTAMGGDAAPMNVVEGAQTSVWLATLPDDGPTGGFFHGTDRYPW